MDSRRARSPGDGRKGSSDSCGNALVIDDGVLGAIRFLLAAIECVFLLRRKRRLSLVYAVQCASPVIQSTDLIGTSEIHRGLRDPDQSHLGELYSAWLRTDRH